MMLTLAEIRKKVLDNRQTIKNYGVKKIGFFGSYVRGEQREDSDIDMLVIFDEEHHTYANYFYLYEHIESLLQHKIDLLTPEGISGYILPYVEKEAIYETL
jgi:predicted nucleotidyltransferase